MAFVTRKNAIKIIWGYVQKQHWSNEEFHENLRLWGFSPPSISKMETKQIQELLHLFGFCDIEVFQDEKDKSIYMMKKKAKYAGKDEGFLKGYIKKHYNKEHFRELEKEDFKQIFGMLRNYTYSPERKRK